MAEIRPRRSVLSMPGSNARAIEKARTLPADCIMLDLEDSVAPEAKDAARGLVAAAVEAGGFGRREVLVRVNGAESPGFADDLAAARGAEAIVIPKINGAGDLALVREQLGEGPPIKLWTMIETPLAILNIRDIAAAAAHPLYPLAAFVIGPNDLARQTRAVRTADRLSMLAWYSTCVLAARAHGIDMIDGVFNDFRDELGFAADCSLGRKLGMDGKHLIHPTQIAGANAAFGPAPKEVAWSRKVLAAFEAPENAGLGVIAIDGEMVELLHAEIARRTVALAEAIALMESGH
ncbi:MAG: CoA ester lyase [Hyphomicrobiales bacterium]|nr:CoA ester lyase [Hyphomicrobiales bacterium]